MALSRTQAQSAPAGVQIAGVVPNPIRVDRWPLRTEKQDYLLWIGRMDPVKGAHRAIEAARLAGRALVLAGPVQTGQEQYFREQVEPMSTAGGCATSARSAGAPSSSYTRTRPRC